MTVNRIEIIDRLKGFAILWVVLGHYVLHSLGQKDMLAEIIGSFHMPLFMFLSGYVVSATPSFSKCCKKVVSFMLPMTCVGVIYAFFIGSSLYGFIHSPYKHGYWYLYVLTVFYIMLYAIGTIGGGILRQVAAAVFVFVVFCSADKLISAEWNDIFSVWMMKQYWLFFITAHFLRRYNLFLSLLNKRGVFSISLIGYVLGFLLYLQGIGHLFYLNAMLFIVAISFVFLVTKDSNRRVMSALSCMGRHTLDIYLFHFFIISMTSLSSFGCWLALTGNMFIELLSGVAYSFMVAYICMMVGRIIHLSGFFNNIVFGRFVNSL